MSKRKGNYFKKRLPLTDNIFIGKNIQKYRRLNNIKQETLAKTIGISRVSLSNYENCNWHVPIDIWLFAAKALNVNPNVLAEEIFTPPPENLN